MSFNPALPLTDSEMKSAEMRSQFLGLKDLIDAPETDPVFLASEAALLQPGDKAKLDSALQAVPLPLIGYDADDNPVGQIGFAATGAVELERVGRLSLQTPPAHDPFDTLYFADDVQGRAVVLAGSPAIGGVRLVAQNGGSVLQIDPSSGNIFTGDDFVFQCPAVRDGSGNAFLVEGANVSALTNDAGYLAGLAGQNVSELTNDAGYVTGEYVPADPSHWAGSPPATLSEAIDRLAAAVSGNGATPIP